MRAWRRDALSEKNSQLIPCLRMLATQTPHTSLSGDSTRSDSTVVEFDRPSRAPTKKNGIVRLEQCQMEVHLRRVCQLTSTSNIDDMVVAPGIKDILSASDHAKVFVTLEGSSRLGEVGKPRESCSPWWGTTGAAYAAASRPTLARYTRRNAAGSSPARLTIRRIPTIC